MIRRRFLGGLAATAAFAPLLSAATSFTTRALIDTNVWLGHWPTRRAPFDTAKELSRRLRARGVSSAWAGNFDSALHTDLAGLNARTAAMCAEDETGLLVPFGAINPTLPDWEDDLRRCHEEHRMPGIRLLPSYHGYTLEDARFAGLLELATEHHLIVQIALTIEDERSQNPALTAVPTVAAPLAPLVEKNPRARVMLLNATSRLLAAVNPLLRRLAKAGVLCEIATLEGAAGIENVLKGAPELRLCFGSHTPYFYFEAAQLKLQESALSPAQLTAIASGHATALLTRA